MRAPDMEIRPVASEADSEKIKPSRRSTASLVVATDRTARDTRPTWDELVETSIIAQGVGYELGFAHGYRDAVEQAEREQSWENVAQVVRNAAADLGVLAARRRAGWGR